MLTRTIFPPLSPASFRKFCELAYQACGINLPEGKEQLVVSRLLNVMREEKIANFEEYYEFVRSDSSGKALEAMVDSLTTHHTGFFREPTHFEFIEKEFLPEIGNRDEIAVWSAACATGEEAYSLLFTLVDSLGESALPRIKVLATDVSRRVLEQAARGLFESGRLSGFDSKYLRRYFLKGQGSWSNWFMVKKQIRDRIDFRHSNLIKDFSITGKFPLILCRNVMIYFDSKTQAKVVASLSSCLEPGGYLFTGHSESLGGTAHSLSFVAPAIYRREGSLSKAAVRRASQKSTEREHLHK